MVDNVKEIQDTLKILGKGARVASQKPPLEVIPTDIVEINDQIFGVGGLPRGKVIEMFSKPGIGKSSMSYWLAGQVQKREGIAVLFDAEGAYYPNYGKACGIDNDKLIIPEFSFGEDCLFLIKLLLAKNLADIIILDSMPALQPALNAEVTAEQLKMNQRLERAKMYTIFFNDLFGGYEINDPNTNKKVKSNRKYFVHDEELDTVHKIHDKKACLIMINHAKDKIGVMWGERIYTPCGDSINFASSIRIGMSYIGKSKTKAPDGGPKFKEVEITAAKNKLAPPLNKLKLQLLRTGGITLASPSKEEIVAVDEEKELVAGDPEENLGLLKNVFSLKI